MNNVPKVLLAEDNDRDMLEYLHEAFQSEVNVCDQCGHEEPTSTCDSASDLKDYLSHFPVPPQPIYDEAKERELFEAYCAKVGLPLDTLPSGEYLIPVTRFVSQGWLARAKAGEDE